MDWATGHFVAEFPTEAEAIAAALYLIREHDPGAWREISDAPYDPDEEKLADFLDYEETTEYLRVLPIQDGLA